MAIDSNEINAPNKPSAIHFTLIAFVMLSMVLGIIAYMKNREFADQCELLDARTHEVTKLRAAVKSIDDQREDLKKLVGSIVEVVDDPANPQNATTAKIAALIKSASNP